MSYVFEFQKSELDTLKKKKVESQFPERILLLVSNQGN